MKHRFIVAALLTATLLSGCGTQTTEVMAPVESRVSEATVEVDGNWWNGKIFQRDDGMLLWGEYNRGVIAFYIGKNSFSQRVAVFYEDDYTITSNGKIKYESEDNREPVTIWGVVYDPNSTTISCMEEEKATGELTALCGTYELVQIQEQPQQEPIQQPEETEQLGEYATLGRYQCFETDTEVMAELQDGMLVLYFYPDADTYILERNGADTGWEFLNYEFSDIVYTNASLQDNELTITSTEPWKYDGTYIQLPDTTE